MAVIAEEAATLAAAASSATALLESTATDAGFYCLGLDLETVVRLRRRAEISNVVPNLSIVDSGNHAWLPIRLDRRLPRGLLSATCVAFERNVILAISVDVDESFAGGHIVTTGSNSIPQHFFLPSGFVIVWIKFQCLIQTPNGRLMVKILRRYIGIGQMLRDLLFACGWCLIRRRRIHRFHFFPLGRRFVLSLVARVL
ncbi:MAG: hypothetical protein IPK83_07005 [Planctomycetes bacterium]|nr:hypothetical protein [Planctomycetota bacterium]